MFPMDRRPIPVFVEYDSISGRVRKRFDDSRDARRFFCHLEKHGQNPSVIRSEVMCPEVPTTPVTVENEAPKAKKAPAKKPVAKPAARPTAKKAPAKELPKKQAKTKSEGDPARRHGSLGREDREALFLKVLRQLGATSSDNAVSREKIVAKSREVLNFADIYSAGRDRLAKEGMVRQATIEGVRGISYYLTAKGAKAE